MRVAKVTREDWTWNLPTVCTTLFQSNVDVK